VGHDDEFELTNTPPSGPGVDAPRAIAGRSRSTSVVRRRVITRPSISIPHPGDDDVDDVDRMMGDVERTKRWERVCFRARARATTQRERSDVDRSVFSSIDESASEFARVERIDRSER